MSKFTTEVRFICEVQAGLDESVGANDINSIISSARRYVFGNYPIYDENYREILETKILKHYYTREISEETVGLWRLRVNDKMNIIMPYYNQLYLSTLLNFNPFYDVDLTRDYQRKDDATEGRMESENQNDEFKRNVTETGVSTGVEKEKAGGQSNNIYDENIKHNESIQNSGSSSDTETRDLNGTKVKTGGETDRVDKWDLYSDTPQGGVGGIQNASGIGSNAYLTNARHITDSGTKTFNNETDTTTDEGTVERESSSTGHTTDQTVGSKIGGTNENYNSNSEINKNEQNIKNANEGNTSSKNTQRIGNSMVTNMSEYIEHVVGKQGGNSYSKMLIEFRETMLNIDAMIINELESLFFGLWE